jgi:hypothetical protein
MIKKIFKKILNRFNYDIISIHPDVKRFELKDLLTDPRSIRYHFSYKGFYTTLPLDRAKVITIPINEKIERIAVSKALEFEDSMQPNIIKKYLESYANKAFSKSASETMGLVKGEFPALDNEPSWLFYYPWYTSSISERKSKRKKYFHENEYGTYNTLKSINDSIEFESKRTYHLYDSIKKNGYRNDKLIKNDDVGAILMFNENLEFNWLIYSGFHRCSVCHALGYKKIEVSLKNIIFRDEVDSWPAVANNICSREVALKIFDNIFYSKSYPRHREWINKVNDPRFTEFLT